MNADEQKEHAPLADGLAALEVTEHKWIVFAQLRSAKKLETRDGRPFVVLELADKDLVIAGKIWNEHEAAIDAAVDAPPLSIVKVLGRMDSYKGNKQLIVERLKVVDPGDAPEGFDPGQIEDPALEMVEDLCCRTLVFDIETVPAFDRKDLPESVDDALKGFAARQHSEPDLIEAEARKFMGMSPFFGKVVSLAIGDGDSEQDSLDDVTVLAVPPDGFEIADADRPPWLRLMSEADLLRAFWALCSRSECVVSFNGRGFDVPFLVSRSLIHGIPARVDLVSQRFALRPHLDLFEILTQRGRGPSKLDVICWALGIESPKEQMDGSMVAPAYARGEIVKIAEYNRHDVRATTAVYRKVRDLVLRYRGDWNG
ncbi:MAG: ribonuclease H-like domain-containing protein [Planctomycetes bacterium]|nr:ribonuclease H-like domain-containing protein [Planctomycetota bacterium]